MKKNTKASHLGLDSCRLHDDFMHTVSLSQDENLRRHISFKRTPTRLKLGRAYQSYHCGTPCWFPCIFKCQNEVEQHVYQAEDRNDHRNIDTVPLKRTVDGITYAPPI